MDNMNDIGDIISNLSADDIDMLKGVASSILGGEAQNNTQNQPKENNAVVPAAPDQGLFGLDNIDFDMIMKAKTIFEKMNHTSNKNVDLIMALKPHLDAKTQNKADRALRILKLFEVLPLLREMF